MLHIRQITIYNLYSSLRKYQMMLFIELPRDRFSNVLCLFPFFLNKGYESIYNAIYGF